MKKVRYNDTFIYIDDTPVEDSDTGIAYQNLENEENIDKTLEIETISKEDLLSDTITDLWGNKDE